MSEKLVRGTLVRFEWKDRERTAFSCGCAQCERPALALGVRGNGKFGIGRVVGTTSNEARIVTHSGHYLVSKINQPFLAIVGYEEVDDNVF